MGLSELQKVAGPRKRFRELGFSVGQYPTGKLNSITDVAGVKIGYTTVKFGGNSEDPSLPKGRGRGVARTGVTAVIPGDNIYENRQLAGAYVLNGAGELTGITQLSEWGLIETGIFLTNTLNVGKVADSCIKWMSEKHESLGDSHDVVIPVVGECDDSFLNDIRGNPISTDQVYNSILSAKGGPVAEGNVGGGTGMICCDLKGGTGTSSRRVTIGAGKYTLGVLVQNNFGTLDNLQMIGVPVGRLFARDFSKLKFDRRIENYGSIIVVIATDAPLWEKQITRLCKRAALGIGKAGSYAAHNSGEILVGFSTANKVPRETKKGSTRVDLMIDESMNPLYEAVIECTEEAIYNSICMAEPMAGFKGRVVPALPLGWLEESLSKYSPRL